MTRYVKSGDGWRIGWDNEADVYCGLIGGDRWSFELTNSELKDFCKLLFELDETIQQVATELMDSEKITCEAQSNQIWLEADGYPDAYDLYVMALQGRRAEGFWPSTAVPDLLQASQTLDIF